MNWSNEWKDTAIKDCKNNLEPFQHELIFNDWKVKAIIVGDLAVHSDKAGWSYVVTHIPTMCKFANAVPSYHEQYVNHSKSNLINWCGKVQAELKDDWTALRSLTPDNYRDLPEVRLRIRDWCLSCPVE